MYALQKRKRMLAELTLCFGMAIFTNATENSRLAGLQRKLQKVVLPDLKLLQKMTKKEIRVMDDLIERWLKAIGWWKNPEHVANLTSFCMDMIDGSPIKYNPRIMGTLEQIAEHIEAGEEWTYPTREQRTKIAETWKIVYA